ncbi:C6 zinc finger protein [Diaporthe helianthi]|uniref:C6 zinc finger protein n=1 Tax=Diaporthe helianthi TaxID=158607 RepID=A0A2P5HFN3_DIAHE|nr:C6 zinc finger protein [Diaporthe helianthi]
MSRRQNSSCDQCRKGKRACDAVWLRDQRALDAPITAAVKPPQAPGNPAIPSHGGNSTLAQDQLGLEGCPYPVPGPDRFQPAAVFRDASLASSFLPLEDMRPGDNSQHMQSHFMPDNSHVTGYGLGSFTTGPPAQPHGLHSAPETLSSLGPDVWSSPASLAVSSPTSSDDLHHVRKRRRTSTGRAVIHMPTSNPPWDWMSGNRLSATTNSFMIGETMMKIYHDVMEGALACWLVEHTCPYKSLPSTPSSTGSDSQQQFGAFQNMPADWGPDWSNRVYRRVVRLDRMPNLLGLRRLSPADERKVSHALNSAVMAFTAQWAQSSERSKARWSARDSLDLSGRDSDTSEAVEEILRGDSQQIWLERATRRLHVLRRRVELHDRNIRARGGDKSRRRCDDESKKTIDLLFWLAVMFDTISAGNQLFLIPIPALTRRLIWTSWVESASMTERPLTVSDEDSSIVALTPSSPSVSASASKQWNMILSKDQQTKVAGLRLPLADEVIAQELIDAAPVKVLLYRKVTRLQSFIARDVEGETIQDAVEDSLMVCRHWDHLYHPLFADCIRNHLSLSARIQSWYVCLLGHWLLGTLLMADLVECVDQQASRSEFGSWARAKTREARHIRAASVRMISDLAKASTPRHDDQGVLVNFHHAVSEGALLTEPWTMILIRTFSRAALILLEGVKGLSGDDTIMSDISVDELNDNSDRCQDCVRALWYLGRKSDMAREVANVLGLSLHRTRMRVHI